MERKDGREQERRREGERKGRAGVIIPCCTFLYLGIVVVRITTPLLLQLWKVDS